MFVTILLCGSVAAPGAGEPPVMSGPTLSYPEGVPVPRSLTPAERAWLVDHPLLSPRGTPEAPSGPIECVAEYEPMDGILMSWEGGATFTAVLAQLSAAITNSGNADVYMVVDTAGEQSTASASLSSAGVNMSRVKFLVRATDTIWIRDYGPRYIFEGDCRAIVDHVYNRPRPLDDALPTGFASYKNHARYDLDLIHGGGNYHLDAVNRSYCTRLIVNENPTKTEPQIHALWLDYQAVDTLFFDPFPMAVDSTQHLDMWMQIIADDKVVISDWPNNAGSTQDVICDNAAVTMANRGYTVYRVPARSVAGVHYTYTNVVMCNGIVLLPSYTNATVAPHNATALANWQAALPDKTIIQVNGQPIVTSAGVFHCIVMHVPGARGNGSPTAYLKNLRGGEVLTPGAPFDIRWISDDDVGVSNVDLLLSIDGGATYGTTIASATAPDGTHTWNVPAIQTPFARVRVVARDVAANTGANQSDANFTIGGPILRGDVNCDGLLTAADAPVLAQALIDPTAYAASYALCDSTGAADVNSDGVRDGADVQAYLDALLN